MGTIDVTVVIPKFSCLKPSCKRRQIVILIPTKLNGMILLYTAKSDFAVIQSTVESLHLNIWFLWFLPVMITSRENFKTILMQLTCLLWFVTQFAEDMSFAVVFDAKHTCFHWNVDTDWSVLNVGFEYY